MYGFKEYEDILGKVIKIGEEAEESLRLSMRSLVERNVSLCEEVERLERRIDFLNLEIEELCLRILSKGELTKKDFRYVATVPKISERFERIGDLSVRIGDLSRRGLPKPLLSQHRTLLSMSKIALEMLDMNLEAISKGKSVSEEEFKQKDDAIDNLYEAIYGQLVAHVHQNPKTFDDAFLLLSIAQTLERIGDISCKIANRIIYIAEGRRVWLR